MSSFLKKNSHTLPAPIPGSHSIEGGAAVGSSHLILPGSPVGDLGGGRKWCAQRHKTSLRGYIDASGGPVGKKDIFLDHGPVTTSCFGHAVMSDSTPKPCREMQPPQEAWTSRGDVVCSRSFGRESALKAVFPFLTPSEKGSSTFC